MNANDLVQVKAYRDAVQAVLAIEATQTNIVGTQNVIDACLADDPAALPAAQREAFLLHQEGGLELAEIAELTGAGVETVKSRLRYAQAKLRAELAGWRVFDRPLTIIHLAAHFAQHLFAVRSILDDVAAAWNCWGAAIDHEDLVALAGAAELTAVLDFALSSAVDLGMLALPTPELRSPRAARLRRLLPAERLFTERPEVDHMRMLLALLLASPWRIPRWARNLLFPPIENMSVIVGRPVSPALYLRYFTRPLRPLGRLLGKSV
jgi:hypothetical protein